MEFDAGLLIFLFIFVVLPLIQRVLGRAKQAPPAGRPGQRRPVPPTERPESRTQLPDDSYATTDREQVGAFEPAHAEPERAADLVPDDLWKILTGEERRSPSSSQRQRTPAPEPEPEFEWGSDAEEEWRPEEAASQTAEPAATESYHQPAPVEVPRHRQPERTAATIPRAPSPITASEGAALPTADKPLPYASADADAYRSPHAPAGAPEMRRRRTPPWLSDRSELKRAFVLREVLGPPKALE